MTRCTACGEAYELCRSAQTVAHGWTVTMTDYTTREYIIRETTYPDATKQELIWELVRCKDCKLVGTDATCCLVCEREGMGLRPFHVYHEDYCSRGERKDGNGNEP